MLRASCLFVDRRVANDQSWTRLEQAFTLKSSGTLEDLVLFVEGLANGIVYLVDAVAMTPASTVYLSEEVMAKKTIVTYKYAIETAPGELLEDIQRNLKFDTILSIADFAKFSGKESSEGDEQSVGREASDYGRVGSRRQLEVLELDFTSTNSVSSTTCKPKQVRSNLCTVFDSQIAAKFNNLLPSNDADRIQDTALEAVTAYARQELWKSLKVADMTILTI